MEAWHFISEDRKMRFGNHELIEAGKTYRVDCELILCKQGLHASRRIIDALDYAPGPIICRVRLGGTIIHDDDKSVATERTVLWMADATTVLREFTRWCALSVAHLWEMPNIVRKYLETGDEQYRDAARAAMDAARAARDAVWAAMDAARDAMNTARDAMDTARAARDAAWDAAEAAQNTKLEEMVLALRNQP